MSEVKYMDFHEFWKLGLLQEINRQFMHPRGLAFQMDFEDDKAINISGIWDERDDPEGIIYSKEMISDNIEHFEKMKAQVQKLYDDKAEYRQENLGFIIQPIEKIN